MAYNKYRGYFKDITVNTLLPDASLRRTAGGGPDRFSVIFHNQALYWGFSHDVLKIQTTKQLILLRFYFHDV